MLYIPTHIHSYSYISKIKLNSKNSFANMPRDLSIFYMVLEPDKLTLTIKSFNFKYLFVYPKTVSVHSPDSPET